MNNELSSTMINAEQPLRRSLQSRDTKLAVASVGRGLLMHNAFKLGVIEKEQAKRERQPIEEGVVPREHDHELESDEPRRSG